MNHIQIKYTQIVVIYKNDLDNSKVYNCNFYNIKIDKNYRDARKIFSWSPTKMKIVG